MEQGVLYIAAGPEYIQEAVKSAESLKEVSDINTTLISDQPTESEHIDKNRVVHPTDLDSPVEYDPKQYKLLNIDDLPYERTLFVDTDTYFYDDISTLFSWLDNFDMAIAHAPHRRSLQGPTDVDRKIGTDTVPECFPDHNGGVVLLKDNDVVQEMIQKWKSIYISNLDTTNREQPALRKALFESNIRYATLPPKYNYRYYKPAYVEGKIKIFHGRYKNIKIFANKLNRKTDARVTFVKRGTIKMETIGQSPFDQLFAAWKNNTPRELVYKIVVKTKQRIFTSA